MNPTIGLGTRSMLAAAIAATGAAIAAAVTAGSSWYADAGVTTLIVAAIGSWAALFTGRSYQAGKLAENTDPTRAYDLAPDSIDRREALDVSRETMASVHTLRARPEDDPPAPPRRGRG